MLFDNTGMFIYNFLPKSQWITHSLCHNNPVYFSRQNIYYHKQAKKSTRTLLPSTKIQTSLQRSNFARDNIGTTNVRSKLFCPAKIMCVSGILILGESLEFLQRPKLHRVRNSISVSTCFVHRALYWFKATSSQGFMFPSKCITAALRIASGLMLGL